MERQNGLEMEADELRAVADFIEDTALDVIAAADDADFPLAQGDLKVFPRPSPSDRAAQQGLLVLRESAEQAAAALHALAKVRAARGEVAALLPPFQGYIDAYRAAARAEGAAPPQDRQSDEVEGDAPG